MAKTPDFSEKPVGIFDSGIGGLTVVKAMRRETPHENFVYFGDTAHVPYGTKSKETVTKFCIDNVQFLRRFGVKAVVVACNTASSLSLDALREKFDVPLIGVIEPGAKQALKVTKNGHVGVIGTKATIGSGAYEACLKRMDGRLRVYSQACPLFVPFAEEGWVDGDIVSRVARVYLEPLRSFKIDTLILGCTHYPLLEKAIEDVMGGKVALVNSAEETAKETRQLLAKLGLAARRRMGSSTQFYVSDEPEPFRVLGERFLGQSIASVAKVGDYFREATVELGIGA